MIIESNQNEVSNETFHIPYSRIISLLNQNDLLVDGRKMNFITYSRIEIVEISLLGIFKGMVVASTAENPRSNNYLQCASYFIKRSVAFECKYIGFNPFVIFTE